MNTHINTSAFVEKAVGRGARAGFSADQLQKLREPVPPAQVKGRIRDGKPLSYIEGWYAITKANEIFGEADWDRETISIEPLQCTKPAPDVCGYIAKVRITVRSKAGSVVREGTGFGWANGASNAFHERALKAAETDATKRALATFGAAFGLSLYDEQAKKAGKASYSLFSPEGGVIASGLSAEGYCAGFRQLVSLCRTVNALDDIQRLNLLQLEQLKASDPDLKNSEGAHFADLLVQVVVRAKKSLGPPASELTEPASYAAAAQSEQPSPSGKIDKTALPIGQEKRYRDKAHLQNVGQLPCLICNRQPSHAHHLKFAQKKGMAQKVSDEFVVPLCGLHHGDLHRASDEQVWWHQQGLDPLPIALELWTKHRGGWPG